MLFPGKQTSFIMILAAAAISLPAQMEAPAVPFKKQNVQTKLSKIPEIKTNGFFNGDKSFTLHPKNGFRFTINGRNYGHLIASFRTDGAINANTANMKDAKLVYDKETKTFRYTGLIPLDHGVNGKNQNFAPFTLTVKLEKDGLIRFSASYDVKPELKNKFKGPGSVTLWTPVPEIAARSYRLNGTDGVFPGNIPKHVSLKSGTISSLELNPESPDSSFTIKVLSPPNYSLLALYPNQLEFRVPFSANRKVDLLLDIRQTVPGAGVKSSDTHAGIDFWKSGRLHVPDFSAGRNLLPNPSFEGGLRYYTYNGWGDAWTPAEPMITISEKESRFGSRSLCLYAGRNVKWPGLLQTSAIPVLPDQKYSFSFFAKADQPDCEINFTCVSAEWPKFPDMPSQKITTEWKRYTVPFQSINRGVSIAFQGAYRGKKAPGAHIYLDGFQLEKGDRATEFEDRKIVGELTTAAGPGNFLTATAPVNPLLRIAAAPNTNGVVELTMEDFFGKRTPLGNYKFKTDAKGNASVKPALARMPGRGMFCIEAKYKLSDGSDISEYYRISVMDPMHGKHKNKNTFGTIMQTSGMNQETVLKRYHDIGFGSTCYGPHNKEIFDLYRKYGFQQMDHSIYTIMAREKNPLTQKLREADSITPEIEKEMEEVSYDIAKRHPWITNWYGTAESDIYFKVGRMGKLGDIAKLQRATLRGVKRFDPNKIVYIEGGPCNMMPQNGTKIYEEYMKDHAGKARFDAAAIHPYMGIPEMPDLDEAAVAFFDALKKYGYEKVPVYWKEGIYYSPLEVPEWNLSLLRGYDHFRLYTVSYHLAWNERMVAALTARNFLVALKYADRVKNFNGWLMWTMLDCNYTPMAVQKSVNTLARLLGDADFRQDIRFAPNSRCYLFEDSAKRPVAVIWSYIPSVDNGSEEAPLAAFDFKGPIEAFDLMENLHPVKKDSDGRVKLPISSFPIFLRGKPGTLKEMANAITTAKMLGAKNLPLKITATLQDSASVALQLRNLVSRPLQAKIEAGGRNETISFRPNEIKSLILPLSEKISRDRVSKRILPVKATVEGIHADCSVELPCFAAEKRTAPITIDGDLSDWKNVPSIPLPYYMPYPPKIGKPLQKTGYKGDISASYRILWDDKNLYIAMEVKDDKFHHVVRDNGARWANDSLQLFVDTMNDARTRTTGGFDINDYNYDFYPNADGSVTVYCRYVPDQQLAGGLRAPKKSTVSKEIQARFRQVPGGYQYEIAVPYYMLLPMRLKKNTATGLAFTVNDHDGGDAVKGALHSTEGTNSHMHPAQYPVMLLTEP